jgi:hypothetical protein
MFERFTDGARAVVVNALERARGEDAVEVREEQRCHGPAPRRRRARACRSRLAPTQTISLELPLAVRARGFQDLTA